MARIDYQAVARDYRAARGLEADGLAAWRATIAPYLTRLSLPIVDIGSGAGQFSNLFPGWFGTAVMGVDPSDAMRAEAEEGRNDDRVRYLAGDAQHLPLDDTSCGAAWVSTVVHHVPDLSAAAREIRRVLAPSAPLLIRSAFPGRTSGVSLFRFFPEAAQVVESFPTIAEIVRTFGAAGFALEHVQPVPQVSVPNLAAMRPRAALRADTTLRGISDEAFATGIARLDAAMAEGRGNEPVIDYLDLVVLR